jgi:hypothetical protein
MMQAVFYRSPGINLTEWAATQALCRTNTYSAGYEILTTNTAIVRI